MAQALLAVALLASLLAVLVSRGFQAFEHGEQARLRLVPPSETDRRLIYLMWEDRLLDIIAQATLIVLAVAACISAVRLWRRGT